MFHKMLAALTLVGIAAALAGLGTFATPIGTTVPTAKAGTVLLYGVSNLRSSSNPALPLNIDALTFDVSPRIFSPSGKIAVDVQLTVGTIDSITYQCSTSASGHSVTCDTTSPQLTADRFQGVTVAAQ